MVSPFFKRGHLDQSGQQEILQKIGKKIIAEAPAEWDRMIYSTECVIDHSTESLLIEFANGDSVDEWTPEGLSLLVKELRAGMYKEGKGTWFSLSYTITRPGKFTVEYNYDDDPHIVFPTAQGFTNDLKYFPRDEEHIPDWLHEKLREEADGQA
ncbi:antitoxin YezG family protein [Nocardiopsis sp. EMB25]|uniref:immunity protein YezG family protein n=1 Tax=Nocardiopsis sp. EMB25 TaxID=2835867 RepID=UPI002283DD4C|nr:immunity protein YezG family protein [Nocardiopsis sp. EMB25]MCY9787064.1 antitoxin YezG family protein [Nocardiopsis sp. EMB25]